MSDKTLRSDLLRIASELPRGDKTRRQILAALQSGKIAWKPLPTSEVEKVLKKQHDIMVRAQNESQNAVAAMTNACLGNPVAEKHVSPVLMKIWEAQREASDEMNMIAHFAYHLERQYDR